MALGLCTLKHSGEKRACIWCTGPSDLGLSLTWLFGPAQGLSALESRGSAKSQKPRIHARNFSFDWGEAWAFEIFPR